MKTIKLIMFTAILIVSVSCKKNQTVFNAYFYASDITSKQPLELYIDDKYKGDLTYLTVDPQNVSDVQRSTMLNLELPSGKYRMCAKKKNGNIVSECSEFKVVGTPRKMSSSLKGGVGGQSSYVSGQLLVFRFDEVNMDVKPN